jgi:regulator of sigma D
MSIALQNIPKEQQQAYRLIAELQNERHEVWSLYCHVAQLKPFPANKTVKKMLMRFSQRLIDYVSLGHFGLYDRLLAGSGQRNRELLAAKDLYPALSVTTEAAISFNDKYEQRLEQVRFDELAQDLSTLGENLAKRIDLEDRLCELMLHRC